MICPQIFIFLVVLYSSCFAGGFSARPAPNSVAIYYKGSKVVAGTILVSNYTCVTGKFLVEPEIRWNITGSGTIVSKQFEMREVKSGIYIAKSDITYITTTESVGESIYCTAQPRYSITGVVRSKILKIPAHGRKMEFKEVKSSRRHHDRHLTYLGRKPHTRPDIPGSAEV